DSSSLPPPPPKSIQTPETREPAHRQPRKSRQQRGWTERVDEFIIERWLSGTKFLRYMDTKQYSTKEKPLYKHDIIKEIYEDIRESFGLDIPLGIINRRMQVMTKNYIETKSFVKRGELYDTNIEEQVAKKFRCRKDDYYYYLDYQWDEAHDHYTRNKKKMARNIFQREESGDVKKAIVDLEEDEGPESAADTDPEQGSR
ncbi:hypothetical protein BGZ76_005739, partial [Entomortierella beljakovae]